MAERDLEEPGPPTKTAGNIAMTTRPWKPSKPTAYMLAALSVWPFVYFSIFIGFMFLMFSSFGSGKSRPPGFDAFKYIFPAHLLTMLLVFALTAVYVVHAFRSDEIEHERRMVWVIILFFGNMVAFPIYWWLYIRPSRPVRGSQTEDATFPAGSP